MGKQIKKVQPGVPGPSTPPTQPAGDLKAPSLPKTGKS